MNRILNILLVLLAIGIVTAGGFAWYRQQHPQAPRSPSTIESQQFVDDAMPRILANWDVDTLYTYSDRASMAVSGLTNSEIVQASEHFRQLLGPMKKYEGSVGSAATTNNSQISLRKARYRIKALFEKSEAYIFVTLNKNSGTWKIDSFNVRIPKSGVINEGR